jgi:hypothetical protein
MKLKGVPQQKPSKKIDSFCLKNLQIKKTAVYLHRSQRKRYYIKGSLAERFNALVLKTSVD